MKKLCAAVFTISILLAASIQAETEESKGSMADNPVLSARDAVLSYFIPANGTVTDAHDGLAAVKFEGQVNIKKGTRFSVYRKGGSFYHPVTKELLGTSEELSGRIEVKEAVAPDGLQTCTVIKGDIRKGDLVRMTTSKVKLAFFQERKSDWAMSESFYGSLRDSDRFEIFESYTRSFKTEDLSRLARDLGAEVVLLFSTPFRDEKRYLNTKLFWAEDAKVFSENEQLVTSDIPDMFSPGEKFISDSLVSKEPWGSYRLAGGQIFSMGDVDGNGISELVVSDGRSISIYNFKEALQETWAIKSDSLEKHLSIDIMDVNNNGRAEIFITSIDTGAGEIKVDRRKANVIKTEIQSVKSFVLEYDPASGYRKLEENMPYFFRVAGKTLLMQKYDPARIFSAPVYEGVWMEGRYQPKNQVALPPDVNIYGFTFIDWQSNGQKQIITFDNNGNLMLYDIRGNLLWKSGKTYGKFRIVFEKETYSVANPFALIPMRERLIPIKSGRGEEVVVLNKIPVLKNFPGLGTSGVEVYSLWWDGADMDEKMLLSELAGDVTDYYSEGNRLYFFAKGGLKSFMKNTLSGELTGGSLLYYYNLGDK